MILILTNRKELSGDMGWRSSFNERNYILLFATAEAGKNKDLSFREREFQKGGMIPYRKILRSEMALWKQKYINFENALNSRLSQ